MAVRHTPSSETVRSAADRAEARSEHRDRPAGRGRLSSIDQLPEEAQEDVTWAVGELNRRQRTQADILFELNDRLTAKGVDPVSKSAFNRTSMRLAAMSSRLNEARRIFEGLAPQFTPERVDENTIALGEFIKLLVFELAQNEGETLGTKGAMELARAHLAVIQGQKISTERRAKLTKSMAGKLIEAAETAVEAVGDAGHQVDKKALLRKIREDVYGIFNE